MEATGGSGTALSHWRESVFTNELMTGWAGPGTSLPLSTVTIGSLADLGYTVNYAAADPFIPASIRSLVSSQTVASARSSLRKLGGCHCGTDQRERGGCIENSRQHCDLAAGRRAGRSFVGDGLYRDRSVSRFTPRRSAAFCYFWARVRQAIGSDRFILRPFRQRGGKRSTDLLVALIQNFVPFCAGKMRPRQFIGTIGFLPRSSHRGRVLTRTARGQSENVG